MMKCPRCGSEDVRVQTNTYNKSESRSFLWNLIMIVLTGGFWLLWMIVRKLKETTVKDTVCTCQDCGHSFKTGYAGLYGFKY